MCIIDYSVNIFLPEEALTSSYTSLTAAPHGSSSGSIPPPGTIHWSGCRLLLTNITFQRKRPSSGLWYWVQGARNMPPACLRSESPTILSVWRLDVVLFIQEAVNESRVRTGLLNITHAVIKLRLAKAGDRTNSRKLAPPPHFTRQINLSCLHIKMVEPIPKFSNLRNKENSGNLKKTDRNCDKSATTRRPGQRL